MTGWRNSITGILNGFIPYIRGSADSVKTTENLSVTDGAFWAIYSSMTAPFLVPLIIVILGNNAPVGYVVGVPVLLVPLAQYLSQKASRAAHDLKRLTILITLFDRLLWVPIIFMVFVHGNFDKIFLLLLLLSLRTFFASFSGTTWTLWVPTVVPTEDRAMYFSRRGFIMKIFSLVGYILALGVFLRIPDEVTALLVVFLVGSLLFSSLSLFFMSRIPSFSLSGEDKKTDGTPGSSFMRYLVFTVIWSIGYGMVLPYLQLYVISGNFLGQSETFYTILFITLSIASISSQLFWGRFSQKYGNTVSILITGTLSALATAMLLLTTSPVAVFIPAILYGSAQSGVALTMFNEMIARSVKSRIKAVSAYNLGQSLSAAFGPILANFLFDMTGFDIRSVFFYSFLVMIVSIAFLLYVSLRDGICTSLHDLT